MGTSTQHLDPEKFIRLEMAIALVIVGIDTGYLNRRFDLSHLRLLGIVVPFVEYTQGSLL